MDIEKKAADQDDSQVGRWKTKDGVNYKNKRDFGGDGAWVMIYNETNVLNILWVNDAIHTKHNVYQGRTKTACLNKAKELGLNVPKIT